MRYMPAELEILELMPMDTGMLSGWCNEVGEGGGFEECVEDDDWGGK